MGSSLKRRPRYNEHFFFGTVTLGDSGVPLFRVSKLSIIDTEYLEDFIFKTSDVLRRIYSLEKIFKLFSWGFGLIDS